MRIFCCVQRRPCAGCAPLLLLSLQLIWAVWGFLYVIWCGFFINGELRYVYLLFFFPFECVSVCVRVLCGEGSCLLLGWPRVMATSNMHSSQEINAKVIVMADNCATYSNKKKHANFSLCKIICESGFQFLWYNLKKETRVLHVPFVRRSSTVSPKFSFFFINIYILYILYIYIENW